MKNHTRLTKEELHSLRHPKERSRFIQTIFVLLPLGAILVSLIIASLGGVLLVAPIVLFFLWFSAKLYTAFCMNNTVLVNKNSFPKAQEAIEDACTFFGYDYPVNAYVYEDGSYNLKLMPLLRNKVLMLNSELFKDGNSNDELRFLVGRFIGALASKHYRFTWLQGFLNGVEKLMIFNILLYPYERATKLSGDRMGLAMIDGDICTAVHAMIKLVVGSEIADQVNVKSFIAQERIFGREFFCWLRRALSTFPHHTTRVTELIRFAMERYPQRAETMAKYLDS